MISSPNRSTRIGFTRSCSNGWKENQLHKAYSVAATTVHQLVAATLVDRHGMEAEPTYGRIERRAAWLYYRGNGDANLICRTRRDRLFRNFLEIGWGFCLD